jgi:tetratricopeptide (TPR) repeat protein
VKLPYELRQLPTSAAATALLLPGHRADEVLRVCVDLGLDPLPPVYALADGYLLLLPKPSAKQIVGVVRLFSAACGVARARSSATPQAAGQLLIPVNAELVPPLLEDESEALVRKRGLVYLPGGRVLEYDPEKPIALAALVQLGPIERPHWQSLPAAPALADGINEITQVGVDTSADQIIAQGGDGIGTDDPTLECAGGAASQLAGNTLFQLGRSLAWLGGKMNSPALAGLGAKLLGGAMSLVPALSEKLMGAQEAMLRELLRQFRAGNIDEALKHALPLGADSSRGATIAQNAMLPTHSLFYSLVNLLGSSAGGPASFWFTPDQTYYELLNEYRKQADLAVQRGDFRRAAFIHAKLLHDFNTAAKILAQGGLHRDAAILYEKKLSDLVSAARQWEAAGEIDRAVRLYRAVGDHATAGDLLRRIGEEDRAVQEYQIAAAKLLEGGPRHYEAGELLRVRGQRPDLARTYYEAGWQFRPNGSPLLCATRLVQRHAETGETEPFVSVLTEAEEYLVEMDAESTATFFTEVARLARTPALEPIAEDVKDRALLGVARKIKQNVTTSPSYTRSLANMLKEPAVWPVPLVGDAQHALNEASRRPSPARTPYPTVRAGLSTVTAVCQMPPGNQVFVGFEDGTVVCFEPATNSVHTLTREAGPILSLVVDPSRMHLVMLSPVSPTLPDTVCLRALSRQLGFRSVSYHHELVRGTAFLGTPAVNGELASVLLCHDKEVRRYALPNLISMENALFTGELGANAVIHGPLPGDQKTSWWMDIRGNDAHWRVGAGRWQGATLGWTPSLNDGNTLNQVPLHAVLLGSGVLQLTGLDNHGSIYRSYLRLEDGQIETVSYHPIGEESYRAFACVRADLTAGVHPKGIDWWTPSRVRPGQTKLTLKTPVAAFPLPDAREVLIVDADGLLTRVPVAE